MSAIDRTQGASGPLLSRQAETPPLPASPPTAEGQHEFTRLLNREEGDAPRSAQAALTPEDAARSESAALRDREGLPGLHNKAGTDLKEGNARTRHEEGRHEGDLSSLMSSLFSERMGHTTVAREPPAVEVAAPPAAGSAVQDTVEQLVRQILVSHPDQAGDREVRLVLQDSVLPHTEVRLSRGADGLLSVSLLTDRDDAFQTLVSAQTALREQLATHEQREVRVVVTQTQGGQGSDDASGRRSATYTAYQDGDETSASGGTGEK